MICFAGLINLFDLSIFVPSCLSIPRLKSQPSYYPTVVLLQIRSWFLIEKFILSWPSEICCFSTSHPDKLSPLAWLLSDREEVALEHRFPLNGLIPFGLKANHRINLKRDRWSL